MSMRYTSSVARDWGSQGVLKCTDLPQFDALLAQADQFHADDKWHLRNLCSDSARCTSLITIHPSKGGGIPRKLILDYSRQRITGETMELLFDLADAVGMTERREALRKGRYVSPTEERPVLHHILRMPANYPLRMKLPSSPRAQQQQQQQAEQHRRARTGADPPPRSNQQHRPYHSSPAFFASLPESGKELLEQIHQVREKVQEFSEQLRSGTYRSVTGHTIVNVLCIGGGGLMGPEFVAQALGADPSAVGASRERTLRFITSVDPADFFQTTYDLDPSRTLVLIVSQTFSGTDVMLIARTVQDWLVKHLMGDSVASHRNLQEHDIVAQHMIAVTDNPVRCRQFGIRKENIFEYFPWIPDRYSLFSVVGILPLSLHFSYGIVCRLLEGAHEMDEHFFESPLNDNIPIILGLLGVWNSTFMGFDCRVTLPYSEALSGLTTYLQKMDMESNGKRVAIDGTPLLHESGEIDLGVTGSAAQHTLYQLMHQGRVIPADFIGFMESQYPVDLPGEAVSNHDELMANFFAQPDALAYGKSLGDLIQEDIPETLREHMVCPGNRPSNVLLMSRLDAFAVGQLVAMYEHRTAIQGFLWGINSFDKLGLDLSKAFSRKVRSQLSVSRKTGASVQGFNVSTSTLLEHYLSHGTEQKRPPTATGSGATTFF